MAEKRKIKVITTMFLTLLIVGTLGYKIILNTSFINSLYMTVITISTVGYTEVAKMGDAGKLFSIFMIFWGVGIVGYTFSTIVLIIVDGKFKEMWKGKKMSKKIANMKNHYIVCGGGEIANVIMREFKKQRVEFVLIDSNPKKTNNLEDTTIPVICGDATEENVLMKANIQHANGLVTTLGDDSDNIVIVLSARNLNPNLHIISSAIDKRSSSKLMMVGANKTLSVNEISGRRMAALLTKPNVISFLDVITHVGNIELDLEEVKIFASSDLENRTLMEAQIPKKTGLIVLAIKKLNSNNITFNPTPDTTFLAGDVLLVLGAEEKVEKLRLLANKNS